MAKIGEYLKEHEIRFERLPHRRAVTAVEEARAIGIEPGEVAKVIVLDTEAGHVLAVIPCARHLDIALVRRATGDQHARLATEAEIERDFPEFELGAIPPFASLLAAPAIVDPELLVRETIVVASGVQTESVRIPLRDLLRDERVRIAPITKHPEQYDADWLE